MGSAPAGRRRHHDAKTLTVRPAHSYAAGGSNDFAELYTPPRSGRHHSAVSAAPSNQNDSPKQWTAIPRAKAKFVSLATFLYAFVLTIFSLTIEMSSAWRTGKYPSESVYHAWMFGSLFYLFLYFIMIKPAVWNFIKRCIRCGGKLCMDVTPAPTFCGEGAGSLYLRLGAFVFGAAGIALYCLEEYLCTTNSECHNARIADQGFAIVFLFLQTVFILFHSKISLIRMQVIVKVGFMHLVAVNMWMWFRFVIAKQEAKNSITNGYGGTTTTMESVRHERAAEHEGDADIVLQILPSLKRFPEIGTVLVTFLVEFAILGAGVMYIIWKGIDRIEEQQQEHAAKQKKRDLVKTVYRSSKLGIIFGLLFFAMAVGCGIAYGVLDKDDKNATKSFVFCELLMLFFMLVACVVAMIRMRKLHFVEHKGEALDKIVLVFGLAGEIMFCCAEIDVFGTRKEEFADMPGEIVAMNSLRALQIIAQTLLILMSFWIRADPSSTEAPGKQFITFLIIANITTFLWLVYEGIMKGYGYLQQGDSAYFTLIAAAAPLFVFYRFHSSVCLAEIWSHAYSKERKKNVPHPRPSITIDIVNGRV